MNPLPCPSRRWLDDDAIDATLTRFCAGSVETTVGRASAVVKLHV